MTPSRELSPTAPSGIVILTFALEPLAASPKPAPARARGALADGDAGTPV